ncbi:MAG TPA: beta-galactosidase [Terracidiphilus sp.]|nr:beta-galactosidase [Terracidiphilus sp.]
MNRRKFNRLAVLASIGSATLSWKQLAAQIVPAGANGKGGRPAWNGTYLVGAAYYPEWWPEPEWEVDFRQMHELGINAVRMGEFAWAKFEPSEGRFEFDWMDRAIEIAQRYGIGVILGTATASVPPWLYQAHPDVLSANKQGPYTYGGRKSYNTNSANYLEACSRIVTALAMHYGRNPGVIGWQLDNEPGYPFAEYDPDSKQAFQQWLRKRYGTLDELNRVWNGAFWSNEYSDWSQIDIPTNSAEGGWQPAISLDYRRFFSDSFLNYLRRQADIVHAHSENQFVFTNWPAPTWSVDVYAAAAEFLDATAWDNYVSAPGLSRFERQYIAGFLSDFCRCAGPRQRFLCAEQNAYVPPNADPEGLRLQAYCDLAHGALGQLYFEWRRPLAGNEEHRPSFIKGFDGKINPDKDKLAQICAEMARLGPKLANATTHADIALIYDYSNAWAQGMGDTNGDSIPHYGEIQSYYNGLKTLRRNIDVVPVTAKLDGYKVVVASNLRLVDDATVRRLIEFVAGGGTLVLNDRAATQNMDNSMRRDLSPGPLTEIAGVRSVAALDLAEYNSKNGMLDANLENELGIEFAGADASYRPHTTIESLVLDGAEAIATVRGGGPMAGKPAVTRHRYKQGWVFYAGADSTDGRFYETLARAVGAAAGIAPLIDAPYGVEVTSRTNGNTTFYFLLNLGETPHGKIVLPEPMEDMIAGRTGVREIALGPLDVAVLAVRSA